MLKKSGGLKAVSQQSSSDIGPRVKAIRKRRGLTLQQLAGQARVSKLTVIRIESGQSRPRRRTVEKIAAALGSEPDAALAEE